MSLLEQITEGAQDRVIRQFCEAMLFESCAITELKSESSSALEWRIRGQKFQAKGYRGAFGRIRITPQTILTKTGDQWRAATTDDLLDALQMSPKMKLELQQDLDRTVHLTDLTRGLVRRRGSRTNLPYDKLETAIDEGHPYHPCFKARSGFSDDDHLSYGPEAAAQFQLTWLAIDQLLLDQNIPAKAPFWTQELGDATARKLRSTAKSLDVDLQRFGVLPVHPWQLEALRKNPDFQAWAETGLLAELGEHGDRYFASQSVRTLINADNPQRAHVKTAMAMRNTSSLRIIEPHSVCTAPAISDWLAAIIDSDPVFTGQLNFTILREYAGIIAGRGTPLSGHLAALWRESPEGLGIAANTVMPFNALPLIEPDQRPLIDTWVRKYGLEKWLDRLLEVAVLPVWHLMVAHGIGLEAHAQNLLLTHDDGWPTGLIARDFHESLEYVPELLSRPDLTPDLGLIDPIYKAAKPGQFHLMQSAEALRELVMDTLFIYNMADLSAMLATQYALPETLFWQKIRALLDRHAQHHGLEARQALFDPFAKGIFTESLLTQKLNPGRDTYRHAVANTLCQPQG